MRSRFARSGWRSVKAALLLFTLGVPATGATLALAAGLTDGELPRLPIGLVLPLTGEQAAFGKEAQRGADVALALFRERDARLGEHVSLVVGDSKSLPSAAGAAAVELIGKSRCPLLVGGISSAEASQLAADAAKAAVALVVPLASQVSVPSGATAVTLALDDAAQGRALAAFAKQRGLSAAVVLKDAQAGSIALAGAFAAAFVAGGGKLVANDDLDPNVIDYGIALRRSLEASAGATTAVLLAVSPSQALTVMKQAKPAGLATTFLGGELWDTPSLAEPMRQVDATAYHVAAFAADDPAPETTAFVAAFEQRYGRKPGGVAALAFDAVSVALAAYAQQPTAAKVTLAKAIAATKDLSVASGVISGSVSNPTSNTAPAAGSTEVEPIKLGKSAIVKQLGRQGAVFSQRVPAS